MIRNNPHHPLYDIDMEVACCLTRLPHRHEIDAIRSDLRMSRDSIMTSLERLAQRYRIDYQPGKKDMAIGVPRLSWERLSKDASQYYDKVYGND